MYWWQRSFSSLIRDAESTSCSQACYAQNKNPTSSFGLDADGICPACNSRFETQLRCIPHLSDARRTKCWVTVVSTNIPPLSADKVVELELLDVVARTETHRAGHWVGVVIACTFCYVFRVSLLACGTIRCAPLLTGVPNKVAHLDIVRHGVQPPRPGQTAWCPT